MQSKTFTSNRAIGLTTAVLLLILAIMTAFTTTGNSIDHNILGGISPLVTDSRTRFMKFITFYGNRDFLVPANLLLVFLFIIRKNKWMAITTAAAGLSSLGLMVSLKSLTRRPRPDHPMVEGVTNFSFPSGHAFMSVAFYGLLIWLAAKYIPEKWKRNLLILLLTVLMLTIGFSRMYLRMHYTSDVIAGYSIGIIWLMLVLALMDKIRQRYETPARPDQGL